MHGASVNVATVLMASAIESDTVCMPVVLTLTSIWPRRQPMRLFHDVHVSSATTRRHTLHVFSTAAIVCIPDFESNQEYIAAT